MQGTATGGASSRHVVQVGADTVTVNTTHSADDAMECRRLTGLNFIAENAFPCLGAKEALSHGNILVVQACTESVADNLMEAS